VRFVAKSVRQLTGSVPVLIIATYAVIQISFEVIDDGVARVVVGGERWSRFRIADMSMEQDNARDDESCRVRSIPVAPPSEAESRRSSHQTDRPVLHKNGGILDRRPSQSRQCSRAPSNSVAAGGTLSRLEKGLERHKLPHRGGRAWPSCSYLHAPPSHSALFNRPEDHVLDKQSEQDHREQSGKDFRDQQLILVLEDVPADAA
jgi:hypothetical protein